MLDKLQRSDFEDLDNKTFQIDFGDAGKATAVLESTKGFNVDSGDRREPFALFFRSAGPPIQRIYPVTHEKLGTLEIFLVPIGENEDGLLYEAVFT